MTDSDAGWFEPFPKSLEPLYSALGKVVYAYAYLENIIDASVLTVYHKYGGKSIAHRNEIPRSLSKQTDFLKDSFRKIPE